MDILNLTILEDGTITVKTTGISDGNHMSADALMAELDKMMGGSVKIERNPDAKAKVKVHSHLHAHAGGIWHSH